MRFSILSLVAPLLFATSVFAGENCKCQDGNGQYNTATELCCSQNTLFSTYHGDQSHQCSNAFGGLNNGLFVQCCIGEGHGGAFCW